MQSSALGLDCFDSTSALHSNRVSDLSDVFCEPLAMTSAYTFVSAEEAAQRFSGQQPGNVYTRFTNPTVQAFESRVAALEQAESAVAFASGMGISCSPFNTWLLLKSLETLEVRMLRVQQSALDVHLQRTAQGLPRSAVFNG